MKDAQHQPDGYRSQSLRDRIAEAAERHEKDVLPPLVWCDDMLDLGGWLNEARATMNRRQWRQQLRTIGMPKAKAARLMQIAKSGLTASELVETMVSAKAGVTAKELRVMYMRQAAVEQRVGLPPIADGREWFSHDDHRDGEGDR